jgi:aminoglycoside phosphotransferase (APT) family kinase protein
MLPEEIDAIATALGRAVLDSRTLAGGFSHETSLLTLAGSGPDRVVARHGGPDPAVEAAVMAAAAGHVPVPRVLAVLPAGAGTRPAMLLEYVSGAPLSEVLDGADPGDRSLAGLGGEVGRTLAAIGAVTFERPGFFADAGLTVRDDPPWTRQVPELAASWLPNIPAERLDPAAARSWLELCAAHAPALTRIEDQARLVHADFNPKNIMVTRAGTAWRVAAVLDWEFSFAGCPYGDAANMLRFGADYPAPFLTAFRAAFEEHQPAGLPTPDDWAYLGHVLDLLALTDLLTRPAGNPVADRAATEVRRWLTDGVPR